MSDASIVVVGAGVIGLAVAAAVSRGGHQVIVIERRTAPGQETSSRNSEVIHAGLYYQPGSLKARFCVEGNRQLHALGRSGLIGYRPAGKLVVACDDREAETLAGIMANAAANGVTGLRLLDRAQVAALEPNVRAVAAIESPNTGVLDAHSLVRYLAGLARSRGAQVVLGAEVVRASRAPGGYVLTARYQNGSEDSLPARCVVNAAGLGADTVASLPGLDTAAAGYLLEYTKGNYAQVTNGKNTCVSRLIYPVPVHHGVAGTADQSGFAGLGVHATLGVDGRMRLGPDVEYLPDRVEDYRVRPGVAQEFFESAHRFLPFLEADDVVPESAGIRPKLKSARAGFADFIINEESGRGLPGWVNLIGIESPGLTSSLPIGEQVAALLAEHL